MSAPAIRGWCPGAHRPMASGDGLVVRVRPPRGEITPKQARGLADAADSFGNGLIDLTNRANLQLRGVRAEQHAALLGALGRLGLLDADPVAEGRMNIVADPFRAGGADDPQTRIVAALADGLRTADFAGLPSKFGFVVDTGPVRGLAAVSGDIRIEGHGPGILVRADGCATGRPVRDTDDAAALALALARWFLASGGVGADGRGRHGATPCVGHASAGGSGGGDVAQPCRAAPAAGPGAGRSARGRGLWSVDGVGSGGTRGPGRLRCPRAACHALAHGFPAR
ncbi:Cobalamin biosynthesis protein CobG [Roseibacterium elongatum DSM 19469]|uniref:Cobalamin biosynthesis protein CobG n=1 Tax=Roseicyclus elongatus DSM 19469 TaxID=1294273 RepID=W8RTK2_9RHOB|nr:hypothetical protein [Roseibacterium elongatum]AHM04503.1 Cobalamin biosynthesis protein CobG [Roseibacterium elongatum DSM 19469]